MKKEKIIKQAKWDEVHTKKAQNDWAARLEQEAKVDALDVFQEFTEEKFKEAVGENWYEVFNYHKTHNVKVKNIIAINAKSTQKTKIAKKWQYYKMSKYPWLNAIDTRNTLDLKSEMVKHWRDTARFLSLENGMTWVPEKTLESSQSNYFVRDKNRKDNQEIQFLSFAKMLQMGGYTTNTGYGNIFHHDELSDPEDAIKGNTLDLDQFIATYKLIDEKNEEIFISTGKELEKNEPRHFFTQNRYNSDDPLSKFAEAHFPWQNTIRTNEDGIDEEVMGAKDWMMEDPMENNFIVHYVDKAEEGWDPIFDNTLIVYANKFSNQFLTKNEEWVNRQKRLIELGRPEDLAIIVGDVFEGYTGLDNAYHYQRKDKISREMFENHYAQYTDNITVAIDLDFSRQIVLRPKYYVSKEVNGVKIYRVIREKSYPIKCNGVSDDGLSTEHYFKQVVQTLTQISKYTQKHMRHIKKIRIILDDDRAQWVGRFNYGDAKSSYWNAIKVNFKLNWKIHERPSVIDEMQDTGFVIDIDEPTNTFLHKYLKGVIIKENSNPKKRIEKARDAMVDEMNVDEYGLYEGRAKLAFNNKATRLLGGKNEW